MIISLVHELYHGAVHVQKKTLGDCNGVPWVTVVQLQKQSPKSSLLWEKEWPRESSQNKATGKMCANVSWQLAHHHSLGHVVPVRDEKQLWCHLNDNLLQLQFRLLFYLTCMPLEMKIHLPLLESVSAHAALLTLFILCIMGMKQRSTRGVVRMDRITAITTVSAMQLGSSLSYQ